ncbi:MAG: cohesin domain-containing protein [Acidobacteriota bacterium]|nr:cohesin domain-containing protein [Acidobacteriota bacterium]
MGRPSRQWIRLAAVIALLFMLSGCAAKKAYEQAERDQRRENLDAAVLGYSKAVAMDPGNTRYTVALGRAKLLSSSQHFLKGQRFHNAGQLELAIAEYQQTLLLNPGNEHASNELNRAIKEFRISKSGPSEIEELKARAARRSLGPPELDPTSNIPILMNFKETEARKIFEAVGKVAGINFIFDEKVDDDKPLTLDIGNVSFAKALNILMLRTKNDYKVIDEHTLLIYPDSRQKRQEYEDQVIRTFFLSNADPKTVTTLLRSLLQSRQIAENTDLNSITIKDTPSKVAIAERIINANDKSKGEVIIDVELLEINRTVAKTLGIDLSSKTFSLSFGDGQQSLPVNQLDQLGKAANWTVGVIPSVVLNFLKSDSETKTVAKPQLRVAEGEQAEILIGDRVPIPSTSFNTSQTVGGNIVPITSFTYQNVGITVQIEPRVHHNKEVTLKVQVEISQISSFVETGPGQSQPIIGTRQIQSVLRLRDGETNVIAGLIQTTDQDTLSGVPGLIDIPGIRRIFSNSSQQSTETDIIMTLTPRIVRIPDITEEDLMTLWVGTEDKTVLRGPAVGAGGVGPFGAAEDAGDLPFTGNGDAGSGVASNPNAGDDDADDPRGLDRSGDDNNAADGTDDTTGNDDGEAERSRRRNGNDDDADTEPDDPADDPPQTVAVVNLVPSAQTIGVGSTLVVQVNVGNASNVGSIPFHLSYNPEVMRFVSAAEGPMMRSDGANTVFLARDSGTAVIVGLSRLGAPQGASGTGTLGTFQFQAIAPGNAGFGFLGASVTDPQAQPLPAAFNVIPVEVQ